MTKISKTKINKRTKRKKNPEIVETIQIAKKNNLLELAKELSKPKRLYKKVNLNELNQIKENKILIIGKVLGFGHLAEKKEIVALNFSESAKEKLKKAHCEIKTIKQEIEKNKTFDGFKILK